MKLLVALAMGGLWLVSCEKSKELEGPPASKPSVRSQAPGALARSPQWYRVVLDNPDDGVGPIPFFVKLPAPAQDGSAIIRVGNEDLKAEHKWQGDQSVVSFPIFGTRLEATRKGERLQGQFVSASAAWGEARIALEGTHVDAPTEYGRFGSALADPAPVVGVWRLSIDEASAKLTVSAASQQGVRGLLLFSSGNIVSLAGVFSNGELKLAGFDGTSPYLLVAAREGDGLVGRWAAGQGLDWKAPFTAVRDTGGEFSVGPKIAKNAGAFQIAGVDLSEFSGKPMIVELAGSWCITCKYMTPYLVSLYERYHPRGLEVVTLLYEFTDDETYNTNKAVEFAALYEVPWKIVPVHGSATNMGGKLPRSLDSIDISGFPVSIFVNRAGVVTYVHAGFPGPDAKAIRSQIVAEYEHNIERLLDAE